DRQAWRDGEDGQEGQDRRGGHLRAIWLAVVPVLSAPDRGAAFQLLSNPLRNPAEKRTKLLALGEASIGPVVAALDDPGSAIRIVILLDILTSLHSRAANKALAHLLQNMDPRVRAYASSALSLSHEVCAVPQLVRLLDDNGVYAVDASSHP